MNTEKRATRWKENATDRTNRSRTRTRTRGKDTEKGVYTFEQNEMHPGHDMLSLEKYEPSKIEE